MDKMVYCGRSREVPLACSKKTRVRRQYHSFGTSTAPASNPIYMEVDMKKIPLAKGYEAIVDDEDYDYIISWNLKWHVNTGYASAHMGGGVCVTMQQLILGAKSGHVIDHRNRNRLDNRRQNLRFATTQENTANREQARGRSGYIGVYWNKPSSRWMAHINKDGKRRYLGIFTSKEEAAKVRDTNARECYGQFAWCNFPQPGDSNYEEEASW